MIRLYVGLAAMSLLLIAAVCGPADASHSGHEHELGSEGTATLASRPTAALSSAPSAAAVTLTGLTGRLTYETASEDVTVQFPDATEIQRHAIAPSSSEQVSADGQWRSRYTCVDDNCTATTLTLIAASGAKRDVRVAGSIVDLQWSPVGHAAAMKVGSDAGSDVRVTVDPAHDQPRVLASRVGGFAWRRDGKSLMVEANLGAPGMMLVRMALDGAQTLLAQLAGLPPYVYASPDRQRFAYTASNHAGWQLYVYDDEAGKIVFSGAMGSDGPGGKPVQVSPLEEKVPMFIAWSPDGSKLAFGGGYEAPYFMTLIDLTTGVTHRTDFADGYPGEIVWTRDSRGLAVSTYDPERRHHGAYVVDPATGGGRYLASGCHLVWSPDGRFLAMKGEHDKGVGIVDVTSGDHVQITRDAVDVPIAWVD